MRKPLLAALALMLPGLLWASNHERADLQEFTEEGRRLATTIVDQVRGELVAELERTGPLRAILVCKFSAPEITSRLSRQHGMRITRVSLRPRNRAIGEADAWEQQVLLNFEKKLAQGAKAETLEHSELVQEPGGRFLRYMRAIPTGTPCLACHGSKLSEAVRAQLKVDYPHDRGADYEVGQLRGAVSIKKGL